MVLTPTGNQAMISPVVHIELNGRGTMSEILDPYQHGCGQQHCRPMNTQMAKRCATATGVARKLEMAAMSQQIGQRRAST
jgi:hypothetical protein